jgi:hypothetical protein
LPDGISGAGILRGTQGRLMARTYKRDSSGRFAGGGGGGGGGGKGGGKKGGKKNGPKTTSARGRARSKEAAARQAVKAGGGSRAARSLLTAQRARDFYKATGTGTKRSPSKSSGGSKPAKAAAGPKRGSKGGISGGKQARKAMSSAEKAYRAASGRAREARMLAGGTTTTRGLGNRTDPGARNIRRNVQAAQAAAARVRAMERSRGVSKSRKRK